MEAFGLLDDWRTVKVNTANIAVIAAFVFLALIICYPLIKRLKSREDCCGNEKIKIKRKKLKKAAGNYKLAVEGMHCKNCEKRITEAINSMDNLACRVSLEKQEAVIYYEHFPRTDEVIKKLGEMGFYTTVESDSVK